jgi:hypothetical protein
LLRLNLIDLIWNFHFCPHILFVIFKEGGGMTNYIYGSRGQAVGFWLNNYVYAMNGIPIGQLRSEHVHKLSNEKLDMMRVLIDIKLMR